MSPDPAIELPGGKFIAKSQKLSLATLFGVRSGTTRHGKTPSYLTETTHLHHDGDKDAVVASR
ncbi:MAG: hypothetical protein OEN50_17490 [Deltaproteobacteria bacterium]|nr:hypothetical protein [Deltaproteobacteria bacterium]